MNKIIIIILLCVFYSCAKEKTFIINKKNVTVQPYGWANIEVQKNDSIVYQLNTGNVVWSIVPVILTGWYIYEPVKKR